MTESVQLSLCLLYTFSKRLEGAETQKGDGRTQAIRNLPFLSKETTNCSGNAYGERNQHRPCRMAVYLFCFSLKEEVLKRNARVPTDKKGIEVKNLSFCK